MTTMTIADIDIDAFTPEDLSVFDAACKLASLAASLVDEIDLGARKVSPEKQELIRAAHAAAQAAQEASIAVIKQRSA